MNMLYVVYFICVKTSNYGFTSGRATSWLVLHLGTSAFSLYAKLRQANHLPAASYLTDRQESGANLFHPVV